MFPILLVVVQSVLVLLFQIRLGLQGLNFSIKIMKCDISVDSPAPPGALTDSKQMHFGVADDSDDILGSDPQKSNGL